MDLYQPVCWWRFLYFYTMKLLTMSSILLGVIGSYYLATGTFNVDPKTVFAICEKHPVVLNADLAKGMLIQKAQCYYGFWIVLIAFFMQFCSVLFHDKTISNPVTKIIYSFFFLIVIPASTLFICEYRIDKQIKNNCLEYVRLHIDMTNEPPCPPNDFWLKLDNEKEISPLYYKGLARLLFIDETQYPNIHQLKAAIKNKLREKNIVEK